MTLSDFRLLTDENIDPVIVKFLRDYGFDVSDVKENGWFGTKDADLIPLAYQEQRVIVTHDSDFGTLIFTRREPFTGVLYLRPGHFDAAPHIKSLSTLLNSNLAVASPFITYCRKYRSGNKNQVEADVMHSCSLENFPLANSTGCLLRTLKTLKNFRTV